MHSVYLERLRQNERSSMLRSLVPRAVRTALRRRRYLKRFPEAFVSAHSDTSLEAEIGEGAIVRDHCHLDATVAIGRFSTLGDGCLLRGAGQIAVGPFCSIGPEVVVLSENHAFEQLTTYPLALYRDGQSGSHREFVAEDVRIEADVWIGQRVLVLPGARIGVGSVVAAGSIVTRGNYAPFSVLAGTPARLVRLRLDEATRMALLQSCWWDAPASDVFGRWFGDLHLARWSDALALGRN